MARKTASLYDAKTHLSALVDQAAAGDEIVITKHGKPVAMLVSAAAQDDKSRRLGGWEGKIWLADNWMDPLPDDIVDAMEGAGKAGGKRSPGAAS